MVMQLQNPLTFVVENTLRRYTESRNAGMIQQNLISKVDMTDGSSRGQKVLNCIFLMKNQEVMESWTSGDQPHYVEKLLSRTYTLLEETKSKRLYCGK